MVKKITKENWTPRFYKLNHTLFLTIQILHKMNFKKTLSLFFAIFFLCANGAQATSTAWKENESKGAKSRLIASFYEDDKGQKKLIVGLHFKVGQGWKIYGKGSEGIGMPPSIDFSGSKNYAKHAIIWPQAKEEQETIGKEVYKYSTYHDEVILPIEIDLKKNDQPIELIAKLNYGLCKDVCVPASESFSLNVNEEADEEVLALIQKFYPSQVISKTAVKSEEKAEEADEEKVVKSPQFTFKTSGSALFYALLLAIIGGAILNVMPCVLPILSIKLMSVIKHSNATVSRIRFAFFATACGIISCFLVFAIFAITIQATGNSFGWGFQFQNPYFLISLIVILVLLIGNLIGAFEISFDQFLTNILNRKISETGSNKKNIFIPNFLSGVLSVALATPCSAPFLGSAISFALTQEILIIFLIFSAIGIGFSLPYIILLIAPKLVYLLPKPGNWMVKVKNIMALFLGLTVIWLIYILSDNVGFLQALAAGACAMLLLLCFEIKSKFLQFFSFVTVISLTFSVPTTLQKKTETTQEIEASNIIEFDEMALYGLVEKGETVLVDVTADWCITCKLNKAAVLNNKEVIEKLNSKNILIMRADITKPNEEVMKFLKKHQRFAIPFNAIYGPNAKGGLLTSELLRKKELIKLIDQASN